MNVEIGESPEELDETGDSSSSDEELASDEEFTPAHWCASPSPAYPPSPQSPRSPRDPSPTPFLTPPDEDEDDYSSSPEGSPPLCNSPPSPQQSLIPTSPHNESSSPSSKGSFNSFLK